MIWRDVLVFAGGAAWGLLIALLRSSGQRELMMFAKQALDAKSPRG